MKLSLFLNLILFKINSIPPIIMLIITMEYTFNYKINKGFKKVEKK